MGKIVCENEQLIFDKLSTNVSDYCMTEKEGFKKLSVSALKWKLMEKMNSMLEY